MTYDRGMYRGRDVIERGTGSAGMFAIRDTVDTQGNLEVPGGRRTYIWVSWFRRTHILVFRFGSDDNVGGPVVLRSETRCH